VADSASSAILPPVTLKTESVPEGKVVDFLTGRHVNDTPEEFVRQNIERALVLQYGYAKQDCRPEVRIAFGSSHPRVDIIVWPSGGEHKQETSFLLVECKKPGQDPHAKKDGIEQLKSYMAASLNARYGLWTNGDDRFCFAKRTKPGGAHTFEDIIEIPAFGQTEADAQRPKKKDLKPATAANLLFAFRRCHNYIASNQGMQKPQAFWELLKIIFSKIEDERSPTLNFFVLPSELESQTAADPAKKRIQKILTDKVVKKYPTIFKAPETQTIELRANVAAFVVGQLQGFSLLRSPVDVKGVAYEEIVGSNLRGDRGEFFTPRNACKMAVTMLGPRPDERLVDPACGTGGFLITAMNHALELIEQEAKLGWTDPAMPTELEREEYYRARAEYLNQCVRGVDLNPDLVRAAKMNMVMNNDGSGGLYQANSLANPHTWDAEARNAIKLGAADVLCTNPPFGANIVIDDSEILAQYDLAAIWEQKPDGTWGKRVDAAGDPVLQKSQPPEILFIERCVQLLAPGTGRMAIVIPNGILNNPALGYVRQWLRHHTQILAVVDMARDLFQPKNDVQTSMVLLRRLSEEEIDDAVAGNLDYECFMAITEKIGHDKRGNPVYRRNEQGEDIVVIRKEAVVEQDPVTSKQIISEVETQELQLDDELPEVAEAYVRWVSGGSNGTPADTTK
jgi:type I restriction enzyme M protein